MIPFQIRRKRLFIFTGLAVFAALILLAVIIAPRTYAQSQPQSKTAFEYDVVSVKPSNPNIPGGFMTIPGPAVVTDTFSVKNLTPIMLIRSAYGIPMGAADNRIAGAPGWISSEKFDVEAKIAGDVVEELKKLSPQERTLAQQQMLQAILADRFKLVIHRENKDMPLYTLVVAKGGSKLKESKPQDSAQVPTSGRGGRGRGLGLMGDGGPIVAQVVAVPDLARLLSTILGRPVLDKTGLAGKYDFTLQWAPDEAESLNTPGGAPSPVSADTNRPSLFTALQEQLGLKLESGKGPIEVIVIDHIERPSGN